MTHTQPHTHTHNTHTHTHIIQRNSKSFKSAENYQRFATKKRLREIQKIHKKFAKKIHIQKIAKLKVWNPLRISRSHVFRNKILSRRIMKEITPKFQGKSLRSWGTQLKFTKVCAGGRHEITHGFAKILFPLYDKSRYLDLEICWIDFSNKNRFRDRKSRQIWIG